MIYNDNSCSNCGGVRVEGSTLCMKCLPARLDQETRHKKVLMTIVDDQDLMIAKLRVLCERLLDHITNDRVSAAELATGMFENWKKKELANGVQWGMLLKCRQGLAKMVEKEAEDEKDGVSSNT